MIIARSEPDPSPLHRPVEKLAGVGPARAKQLQALGVNTLGDLLEYFPRTYQYESAELPISRLEPEQVHIARGEVMAVDFVPHGRRRLEVTIDDSTGRLTLTWFNMPWLRQKIHPGLVIRVRGKVTLFRNLPQIVNPKWEVIEPEAPPVGESRLKPIYPASSALPSDVILRLIEQNIDQATGEVREWFDSEVLARHRMMTRREAYRTIHLPADMEQARQARRRIVYDELMLLQLALGMSRRLRQAKQEAHVLRADRLLDERIRRRFPFQLTAAQQRVVYEIMADMQKSEPMNRLLQGDVGSGKTIVALYAMLAAVANKLQAALLAPTEVLAEQHYLTISNLLRDSQVKIELLTSRTRRQSRGAILQRLAEGEAHIAVGTQSLIQQDIAFSRLGLVVVDEQHRLGVRQRATIRSKGPAPHYLVMTATPIPRTLALSFFADFDVSVIDELPPGRQPIKTHWLPAKQAGQAYEIVRRQVEQGRQAYIVVPQIEDDGDEVKSVRREFNRLSKGPLGGLRLAMLHGQMKTDEKQEVMSGFRDGRFDVLVATTVIEVGIDVPNATVMLIDNADRFGLSQLHQLRGRVGRGEHASICILLADATTEAAATRLRAMKSTASGFEIAETDLRLRGPGDFFGTRQHGLPEFKLADLASEFDLLRQAREDALALLEQDSGLSHPTHHLLRAALEQQFGRSFGLAEIQ